MKNIVMVFTIQLSVFCCTLLLAQTVLHPLGWTRSPRKVILRGGQGGVVDAAYETEIYRGV